MLGEITQLTQEQRAAHQATVDRLAASQAGRMSMQPIDELPFADPLRQYVQARHALRVAGFSGEPTAMPQATTHPIDARMQPY